MALIGMRRVSSKTSVICIQNTRGVSAHGQCWSGQFLTAMTSGKQRRFFNAVPVAQQAVSKGFLFLVQQIRCLGVYHRRNLPESTVEQMKTKVLKGFYDEDLDGIMHDCDDDVDEGS
jgi:hypothetical protein